LSTFLAVPVFSRQSSSNYVEVSEVAMVVDLPAARVGPRLLMLVDNRARAALDHGWERDVAAALGQLPSGACLTVRDASGREWHVRPAARARAASFDEAS
jgi:hypothetical protein